MTKTSTPLTETLGVDSGWVSAASIGTDAEIPTTGEIETGDEGAITTSELHALQMTCGRCREQAQFRIIPVGTRGKEERSFLACAECVGIVLHQACFRSYIVRSMEWEEE